MDYKAFLMSRKLIASILSIVFLALIVWCAGIAVVSKYASVTVEKAIYEFNRVLDNKYKSKDFLYKVSLSYNQTDKSLLGESGYVKVEFSQANKSYEFPIELDYGFFTLDSKIDFYPLFNDFLMTSGLFSSDSNAIGKLHVRLLPFSLSYTTEVFASYSTLVNHREVVKSYKGANLPMHLYVAINKDFLGKSLFCVEADSVYIPGFSADKLFYSSTYIDEIDYQIPLDARVYAKGLILEGELLSQLKDLDIFIKPSKLGKNKEFNIRFDGSFSSRAGHADVHGSILSANAGLIAKNSSTWPEFALSLNKLNSYTNNESIRIVLSSLNYSANLESKYGPIEYNASAYGQLKVPYSAQGITSVLDLSNGKFDINLDGKNILGDQLIKKVGAKLVIENNGSYKATVIVENGKLRFNSKVF